MFQLLVANLTYNMIPMQTHVQLVITVKSLMTIMDKLISTVMIQKMAIEVPRQSMLLYIIKIHRVNRRISQ